MVINWFFVLFLGILVVIFVISKISGAKQNLFTFVVVVFILFSFLSLFFAFNGKEISFTSVDGLKEAGAVYLSWLANAFGNIETITTEAIKLDWQGNNTKKSS